MLSRGLTLCYKKGKKQESPHDSQLVLEIKGHFGGNVRGQGTHGVQSTLLETAGYSGRWNDHPLEGAGVSSPESICSAVHSPPPGKEACAGIMP